MVSKHALVLPLGNQSFRIAVVEGRTPFLISNAFLKGLKAVIDTDQETLFSRSLNRFLTLQKSSQNLFLMDLNQLWETDQVAMSTQASCPEKDSNRTASEVKIRCSESPDGSVMFVDRSQKPQQQVHHTHVMYLI